MKKMVVSIIAFCLLLTGCQNQVGDFFNSESNISSEISNYAENEEKIEELNAEYYYPAFLASITAESWNDTNEWENSDSHWPDRLVNFYIAKKYYSISESPEERDATMEDIEDADLVENFIMQYFDVSREFLRTSQQYDAERGVYILGYLGNAASSKVVSVEEKDGILGLNFEYYSPMDDTTVIRTGTLYIQKNTTSYKYLSCVSTAVDVSE